LFPQTDIAGMTKRLRYVNAPQCIRALQRECGNRSNLRNPVDVLKLPAVASDPCA
jgi:hypothetical protein